MVINSFFPISLSHQQEASLVHYCMNLIGDPSSWPPTPALAAPALDLQLASLPGEPWRSQKKLFVLFLASDSIGILHIERSSRHERQQQGRRSREGERAARRYAGGPLAGPKASRVRAARATRSQNVPTAALSVLMSTA